MNPDVADPLEHAIEKWLGDTALLRKPAAARRIAEIFLLVTINNRNTRRAYFNAIKLFLTAAAADEVHSVADIESRFVRRYLDGMHTQRLAENHRSAHLSRSQALAALRRFFDALLVEDVIGRNPCAGLVVEGHKAQVARAPALTHAQLHKLLSSIPTNSPLGLRDRALFAFLIFTAARIGAALKLVLSAFYEERGSPRVLLFEKGDKIHSMPVTHDLHKYLHPYIDQLNDKSPAAWVFRHWDPARQQLTTDAMPYSEAWKMIRKRLTAAGLSHDFTLHSFRATAITWLLDGGAPLELAKKIANHSRSETTELYDRRNKEVSEEEGQQLANALRLPDHQKEPA